MATGTLRPPSSPFPPQLYKNGHDANKKNPNNTKTAMKQQKLFEIDSDPIGGTEISDACQKMFEDLEAKGLLGPIEQAKRAMVTKAAAALDRGLAQPKVSVATTTVLDKVLAALDSMPRPAEGGDPELDALDAALSHLTMQALATGSLE